MCNSNCPFFCQFHWLHFIKSHRYSWIIEKDTCLTDILYEQMTATFNLLKKCQVKMPLFWFLTQQSPKIHATLQSILKDSMRKMIFHSRLDGWRISYIVWHGPNSRYEWSAIFWSSIAIAIFFFAIEIAIGDRHYVKRSQDNRDREIQWSWSQKRDRDLFSFLLAINLLQVKYFKNARA